MDLRGKKLSDTYINLLSNGPGSNQIITLGDGSVVPWRENGLVVTSDNAQTIDGLKTFSKNLTIQPTVNFASNGSFVKAGNHAVTLTTSSNSNITFSAVTARTYTVPNVTVDASFVMTEGAQTINGVKTFNGGVIINGDTDIGLSTAATNLFGTGANTNRFGDNVISSNTFGNDVTGNNATNSFGNRSRFNYFGTGATTNHFGTASSGSNNFGNSVSGSSRFNNFGSGLISGAQNHFGPGSKNYFGQNGENYFYSGSFAGPITMPATITYTSAGQIVKAGNHTLGLTTTAGTTGTFPTGNINIAALEGKQTFVGEKTFSSGINITNTSNQLVLGGTQKTTITAPTPASARTYTIPDVGGNASFVMTTGVQTFDSRIGFADGLVIQKDINQLQLRTGNVGSNTISISAPSISGNRTYTLPDVSGHASFVMTTGSQTIGGVKNFTSRPTVNGTGIFLNGDSLPGTRTPYSITFGDGLRQNNGSAPFTWDGSQSKTVEIDTAAIASLTGNQSIGGQKTFTTGQIIQSAGGNQLTLRTGTAGFKINITSPTITGDRTYTLPDVGADASFVMTTGGQTINGSKIFTDQSFFIRNGNQLVLRTGVAGHSLTISAPVISGNRTYNIPYISLPTTDLQFVMNAGDQTIRGVKNFTSRPTVNGVQLLAQGDTSIFSKVEAVNLVYNTGTQNVLGNKKFEDLTIQGPFVNDVDADFNGPLSSKAVYCTDEGTVKAAIEIPALDIVYETGATALTSRKGPAPTLTRTQTNTSGTYLGSDGYIKYVADNQPRFDHVVSKNLFYGSNSFDNFWRYPFTSGPPYVEDLIAPRSEVNPFKSAKDADKIIDVTGSGGLATYQIRRDVTLRSGLNYTMSVFAKPIHNDFILLQIGDVRALYNLSNKTISSMGGTVTSSGIDSSYGNGWSRLWMSTYYGSATQSKVNAIYPSNAAGNMQRNITIRSGAFYLWGPQLEEASAPSQYEVSIGTSTNPYKSFRTPKGLLIENNSSNLVLNSNRFTGPDAGGPITGNIQLTGGAWPDGSGTSFSGAVYVEDSANGLYGVYRDPIANITNTTNYVSSIFLKQPASGSILGRRYVLGRLHTPSVIADTRVVIDLDSGISGGSVSLVPGYATPTFYTGIRYPNNWYRLIIGQKATASAASGAHFYLYSTTGSGINTGSYAGLNGPSFQMFGHQIESTLIGNGATSYKPTTGTSGLLGRDIVRIAGNDFQSFYNQKEGTFFIEAELLHNNATNATLGMFGIEGASRPLGGYSLNKVGHTFRTTFRSSPPETYKVQAEFSRQNSPNNISVISSYKENSFKNSFYNEAISTDGVGDLPTIPMNKMVFGANGEDAGPQYSDMYLQRFSYWPLQLQNNKLTGIYRY